MPHPCLSCGACCAYFRVSFHWSEADPALGGNVPIELTEPLRIHERVMHGTSQSHPRCIALDAQIGYRSRCTIHERRPPYVLPSLLPWNSAHAANNATHHGEHTDYTC